MKKLEDISEETTLNTRREVRGERFARHIKRQEDRTRRSNICLIGVPEGKNREKEIMAATFQELEILILIFNVRELEKNINP